MSRHIGIVGVSPEGAAIFYREVGRHAGRMLPPNEQPRVSLHNEPLAAYIDAIRKNDWHAVGVLLARSAEVLARCGAEFCLTPDNIVQSAIPLAEVTSPIPWITMSGLVTDAIVEDGRKNVGVIGTRLLVESSTYQMPLGMKGVHLTLPEPNERDRLERIIYEELIYGSCRPESQAAILEIIHHLSALGCDGLILGSSEVPLVVTPENCPLPLYDPTEILSEAAVRRARV